MRTRIITLLMVLALALAACSPGAGFAAVETPTPTPATVTPTTPPPQDAPLLPPKAALAAQEALAELLGLTPDQVTISLVEENDWTDSCLGLGGPAESCLAAITPGFRVQLTAGSSVYEFRTDREGEVVRQVVEPDSRRLSEKAAALLAQIAGLKLEEITFAGLEDVEWPNACLGAEEEGEMCAEVITPGYRVELEHAGKVYVLHTNADATVGRLGGPAELAAALKVRQVAAQETNTALNTVRLVEVEAVEWPNSCLGVEKQGTVCLQVLTPGYRVRVEAGGQMLEYHTNHSASAIVRK